MAEFLNWHPHLHVLTATGAFRADVVIQPKVGQIDSGDFTRPRGDLGGGNSRPGRTAEDPGLAGRIRQTWSYFPSQPGHFPELSGPLAIRNILKLKRGGGMFFFIGVEMFSYYWKHMWLYVSRMNSEISR